ncbi:unnamed protein product [Heterosigma akashiwo]
MAALNKGIFIVGAKRTPFGAFGGSLKALTATDLCVHSSKAALEVAGLDASAVDVTFVETPFSPAKMLPTCPGMLL